MEYSRLVIKPRMSRPSYQTGATLGRAAVDVCPGMCVLPEVWKLSILLERPWRAALIDLDGTLYRGDDPIAGAAEFVARLREQSIQPVFLTNNSLRTPQQVVEKLHSFGISSDAREVVTSAQASAALVAERIGDGRVGYLGADGVAAALTERGLTAVCLRGWDGGDLPAVEALVLGLDRQAGYMDLACFSLLAMELGWFVLTNGDVRLPVGQRFFPGNGALGRFVATASGVEPTVVGKPSPWFIEYALSRYGVVKEDVFIVGDNLLTDIAAGAATGIKTVWVQSGVQYRQDEATPIPDYVYDSVATII
jgi:4-nitrophenyl phosphatase